MILVGCSLSLNKLAKEKKALCDKKINQLLTSQNTAKSNTELSDELDRTPCVHRQPKKFLSVPWKEGNLSSSHGVQVAGNQRKYSLYG